MSDTSLKRFSRESGGHMDAEKDILRHLIASLTRGDENSWRMFFEEYTSCVLERCAAFGVDDSFAVDILQNTAMTVVDRIHELQAPAGFPAWVRKIIAGKVLDVSLSENRFKSNVPPLLLMWRQDLPTFELHRAVGIFVAKQFSEQHWRMFDLRLSHGKSWRKLSKEFDMPIPTITSTIAEIKRRLRSDFSFPQKKPTAMSEQLLKQLQKA